MVADFSKADLSFAGCGFMCIYHAGVSAALREYAPHLFGNRIYGASAGAIAAAALICDVCISEATSAILQVICEARAGFMRAFSPTFDLMGLARDGMERMLPENAHILCSGRLFISLTRYDDFKNVVISQFQSKEDLIQAVICSCYIPIFCGFDVPTFHGVRYIDGGFSDNQPRMPSRLTITVSPFSGETDICPMDNESATLFQCFFHNTSFRLTTSNFYRLGSCFAPPSQDICSRFCHQGFTDTLRFLTKNAVTPCVRCLTVQSGSLPLPLYGIDQLRFRRHLNSECGLCLERLEDSQWNSKELFPKHLQRTLEITKPSDSRLHDYFWSLRIVRYSMPFIQPVVKPANYSIMAFNLVRDLINSKSKADFVIKRLQEAVDFVLKEIEEHNLLCTPKFTYQRPISAASTKSDLIGAPRANTLLPLPPIRSADRAQIYEIKDHVEHSAYLNDADSVSQMIDYAETHNAILAYHYLDNLNNLRVCEVFDMDRTVPRVKCHSTARFADYYQNKPPTSAPANFRPRKSTFTTLTEEPDEEIEQENAQEQVMSDRTDCEKECCVPEKAENISGDSNLRNSLPRATKSNIALPMRRAMRNDLTSQPIPPDPSSKADESCSSKRDACCSPVRHLNKSMIVPSSSGWRGSAGRINLRSSASLSSGAAQRNIRRHTTIGTSSIPTWSGNARKLTPFIMSRSANSSSLSPAPHIATRSPTLPKSNPPSLKAVHSSDSDDEVEDDELFVVANRRNPPSSAAESVSNTRHSDGYEGESD